MKIGKFKIKTKWVVIIIIILAIAGYFVIKSAFKNPLEGFVVQKIDRGEVLQEVSETGSVQATDNISLGLKTLGKISAINVSVGDDVKKGQILASIDTNQLNSQLKNYQAAVEVAKAQYQKLLVGLTPEDLKTYEVAKESAQDDLASTYASAVITLNDAYTKIYNSLTAVQSVQESYFSNSDQEGIKIVDNKKIISDSVTNIKFYLDTAKVTSDRNDIDSALAQAEASLNKTFNALKIIRETVDAGVYYSKVSSTDKTAIDTQRSNINTGLTNVTNAQQDISADKIALQKAEDNLALKKAKPRQEDIDLYEAQIEQAQANVDLIQSQIADAYLRSPLDGKITKINAKPGEVVSANQAVVNLFSSSAFQIKADIYEQDIVNVKVGNDVKINVIAFPKDVFYGKIILIDPAEKIVDNVVYYQVTIDFPEQPEGIRSGMTADIVILTNKKSDVVRAPKNAVEKIDNKETVQIIKDGKSIGQEITTGLEGNDYFEVVSGLNEGDEIITGKK